MSRVPSRSCQRTSSTALHVWAKSVFLQNFLKLQPSRFIQPPPLPQNGRLHDVGGLRDAGAGCCLFSGGPHSQKDIQPSWRKGRWAMELAQRWLSSCHRGSCPVLEFISPAESQITAEGTASVSPFSSANNMYYMCVIGASM